MAITHYTGDVLCSGADVIAHQVNCKGVMGKGLAATIRKRYPNVFTVYKAACKRVPSSNELLGKIQTIPCGGSTERWIVNCFAQDGFGTDKCYTDYAAFESCFRKLRDWAIQNGHKKIAVPHYIGCGLAGGDWNRVTRILENIFDDHKVILEIWKLD